jgi:polyisoprenoid-binding protein YceI
MRAFAFCIYLLSHLALTLPANAAPAHYSLQPESSTVGFETDFGTDKITGKMPISSAELTLDFDNIPGSKIDVVLNAAAAEASFPFAAQAMKGPKVLDTAEFPTIHFQSTSVAKNGEGAAVEGLVTIRGVTRPMRMQAVVWRQKGQAEGDLSKLSIRLTGTIIRSQFAAVGWNDMVGDEVRLDILARIARKD